MTKCKEGSSNSSGKMSIKYNTNADNRGIVKTLARRTVDHACSTRKPCVRCSVMKVIQYRFKAFRKAFGRNPLPNEPLFFAENSASPQAAKRTQVIRQVTQAADAATVPLAPLLKFLQLS
jgi:hypothetical protein